MWYVWQWLAVVNPDGNLPDPPPAGSFKLRFWAFIMMLIVFLIVAIVTAKGKIEHSKRTGELPPSGPR